MPWPWLSIEARWTLGRILKGTPSRLADARDAVNSALTRALTLLPPVTPGQLQLERELTGALWIELIEILLRRGRMTGLRHELERAIRIFRMYRHKTDVRTVGDEGDSAPVPGLRLRIELICAPGAAVFVVATTANCATHGFMPTGVDELSNVVYRYQSLLYASDQQHPTKTLEWLVEVNRAVLGVRKQLEAILLHPTIEWSDGSRKALACLFREHACVEIIAHGPTQTIPWPILRHLEGECIGETTAIISAPTDLHAVGSEVTATGNVDEELRTDDTAESLLKRLSDGRISWLRGHGRFASSDPLAMSITPLAGGNKRLTTRELLACAAERPLANVFALFVSVCEAGESPRRSVALDFMNVGYAMLVAGARTIIVPTMTVTGTSDTLVRGAIAALDADREARVPDVWRTILYPHLVTWRSDSEPCELKARVERAWNAGWPTAAELGAFLVVQSAGQL